MDRSPKEIVYSPNKYRETEGIKRILILTLLLQRELLFSPPFVRSVESSTLFRFVLMVQRVLVLQLPQLVVVIVQSGILMALIQIQHSILVHLFLRSVDSSGQFMMPFMVMRKRVGLLLQRWQMSLTSIQVFLKSSSLLMGRRKNWPLNTFSINQWG